MPKKNSDYSTTVIYKIYCKDENIKDVYVGHTINFTQRKYSHVKACNNLNNSVRIYKTIRANGGWENWNMIEIATYCCKDLTEARIKENEHYNELQASLNSSQPYVNRKVKKCASLNCNFDKNNTTNINLNNQIEDTNINIEETNNQINNIEDNMNDYEYNDGVYTCNYCNYFTNKKSNYDRHLLSSKHKSNINCLNYNINGETNEDETNNMNDEELNDSKYNCKLCKKNFNSNNSLWKHNNRKHPPMNDEDKINKLTNLVVHVVKQNTYLSQQICQLAKRDTNNKKIIY